MLSKYHFFPFLKWSTQLNAAVIRADLIAGLTGAFVVLPQAIAFATIAGLPPEYGLYAAMVPAIIGALFGSSWHLVSGPTTAISIVIFTALTSLAEPGSAHYITLALSLTFLVGLFQLAMGLARLGMLVNFISNTVVLGFTTGTAVMIVMSQFKNFFGIGIPRGMNFLEAIFFFIRHLDQVQLFPVLVGTCTIGISILSRRYLKSMPYMILAMLSGSVLAFFLNQYYGQHITALKLIGTISGSLPPLSLPDFGFETLQTLAPVAFALAILCLTQAISAARAIAIQTGQRLDNNQEFIGQGLSNLVGCFFSGYASSGSFNRTGLNYAAGAKTPLATIFASLFLLGIVILIAPLAAYLPYAVMAGVLFLVAAGLIDNKRIGEIWRAGFSERLVFLVTFFATLLIKIEFAIYIGIILSLIFFLHKTTHPIIRSMVPNQADPLRKFIPAVKPTQACPQLKFLRIEGALFFGAVNHVEQLILEEEYQTPAFKYAIIIGKGINFIDLEGAALLVQLTKHFQAKGGDVYLYSLRESVSDFLFTHHYTEKLGGQNKILNSKGLLIQTIYPHLDQTICAHCPAQIFKECPRYQVSC